MHIRIVARSLTALLLLLGTGGAALLGTAAAAAAAEQSWTARGGTTSLKFNLRLLEDLGLGILSEQSTAAAQETGRSGFAVEPGSALRFSTVDGVYGRLLDGQLRHRGGFVLGWKGGAVSLLGFELRPAAAPYLLEMRSASGKALFVLDNPHVALLPETETLYLLNMDLRLSQEMARLLGQPGLEGMAVGVLHVHAVADGLRAAPRGSCAPNFGPDIDVELSGLSQLQYISRNASVVSMAPTTTIRNIGGDDVRWYWTIEPAPVWAPVVGQHPYLYFVFYRLETGVFRQISRSEIKHAFFSTNEGAGCGCPGGQVLYARNGACGDTYSWGNNSEQYYFAPRDELTASTGTWTSLGSYFDVSAAEPTPDDVRSNDGPSDSFTHLLQVAESELPTPGPSPTGTPPVASYFIEARYVVQGDVQPLNNLGWKPVRPSRPVAGSIWSLPVPGGTPNHGPALAQWGERRSFADTADGNVVLAVQTTDLGGGQYHYEYALMNLSLDRKIRSFSVPLPPGAAVGNTGFGDVDTDAGNDWIATAGPDALTWQTSSFDVDPQANALAWGFLYNFRFDADQPPAEASVSFGLFEPGSPSEIQASTLGPLAQAALTPTETPTPKPVGSATETPASPSSPTPSGTPTPAATQSPTATSPADPSPTPSPPGATPTPTPTASPTGPAPYLVLLGPLVHGQRHIFGWCVPAAPLEIYIVPRGGGSPRRLFTTCTPEGRIGGPEGFELPAPLRSGERVSVVDTAHPSLRTDLTVDLSLSSGASLPLLLLALACGAMILAAARRRRA